MKTVGEAPEMVLSIDCFIKDLGIVSQSGTTVTFKVLVVSMTPFYVVMFSFLFWLLYKCCKRLPFARISSKLILTITVSMFLVYPTLIRTTMLLFNCFELDANEYWLYEDLNYQCW